MPYQITEADRRKTTDSRAEELRYWVERVHELPDVRMDEVIATRNALRRNCYPGKQVLEEAINRLSNEIGVLCRREFEENQGTGSETDPDGT